jgi:hypothetical protein
MTNPSDFTDISTGRYSLRFDYRLSKMSEMSTHMADVRVFKRSVNLLSRKVCVSRLFLHENQAKRETCGV